MTDADLLHVLWLAYRSAIAKHIETDKPHAETEAQYRERAEKAGLVAVVNLVGKAYQA
jgi:hypothetical protein